MCDTRKTAAAPQGLRQLGVDLSDCQALLECGFDTL
jgi:hypothetical protein